MTKGESLENVCLDMRDYEKIGSDATTSEEEARVGVSSPTAQRRWADIPRESLLSGTPHIEKLLPSPPVLARGSPADNPLVADAEVDEALVAYFNEKYRVRYSSSAGDIVHGAIDMPLFSAIAPSRVGSAALRPGASSRMVHMGSADPGIPATWALGLQLLWMVTCCMRQGEPLTILRGDIQTLVQGISSRHQVLLYLETTRSSSSVLGARACP